MPVDSLMNFANGLGDSADRLIANNFDIGVLRPWIGSDGRNYVQRTEFNPKTGKFEKRVMVTNAPATLPRLAWYEFDNAVVKALQNQLNLITSIRSRGLVYNIPNAMAHTVLQYQKQYDTTPATIGMDPIRRGESDRPTTDYANFPLPIAWKDFDFSAREVLVSRNGNMPFDTTMAELAGIKVAEELEGLGAGAVGPFSFGGGTIYGLINFPQRVTKTDMVVPDGTNNQAIINAILAIRQSLLNNKHRGPFVFYVNKQWSQWLDADFNPNTNNSTTLRQRILAIDDIKDIITLDLLPNTQYNCVLQETQVQSVRVVVGMEVQTIQWESLGGMAKHYKVMAMLLTQLRPDTAGNSGTAHMRTA